MQQLLTSFVAYSSQDPALAGLLSGAIRRVNSSRNSVYFETWQGNDVPGIPLVTPILEKIENSAFVVADITYLNLNVVYEIGFAIGRQKRAFLIRHKDIPGDKALARAAGIFDTLGYFEFSSSEELEHRLAAEVAVTPLVFSRALDQKAPVFIVEPPTHRESSTIMTSRIKKARFKYRSFNPGEDTRMSASDAIRQVASSSGVVGIFQDNAFLDHEVHNVRTIFVAGLADGMLVPRLLLAPLGFQAPLDIIDSLSVYRSPRDIAEAIADFCPEIVGHLTQSDAPVDTHQTALSSLNIGDPRAENEMSTLEHYYLKTDQYQRALRGEINLVVGRKGAGKTALFISVRDRIRADKRNIMVDLKPEGYQLIKLKEEILSFLSQGAREHLITAFWEYLILLEVAHKVLEKDKSTYRFNHEIHDLYQELSRVYFVEDFSTEGDFSERLLTLSRRLTDEYQRRFGVEYGQRLTSQEVTEMLYKHDIKALRRLLSIYLEKKESIWVLFDNLDRGWSTAGVEVLDAIVLRCLIDAGRKVERDMRRDGHRFNCIVFVRNDVYDHLMKSSADHGKEIRATLDWSEADLLREMLRLRLVDGLGDVGETLSFAQVWSRVCVAHYRGEESSQFFIDRSLMRPRNFIKIFNLCRGFAANLNKNCIDEDDIRSGLKAYSQDLLSELDRELVDVAPEWESLLLQFVDSPAVLGEIELMVLLCEAGIDESSYIPAIDFLLYYGVLGLRQGGHDYYIYEVNYDLRLLKVRIGRAGASVKYVVNPGFWPALNISEDEEVLIGEPTLNFGLLNF
jgi:hypothetical protein